APFLCIAGASALLLLALFTLPSRPAAWKEDMPPARRVLTVPQIFWGAVTVTVAAFGYGIVEPLLPADLNTRFGLTMSGVGLAFGVMSAVYAAVQPLLGWLSDRKGHLQMIVSGALVTALLAPTIAVAPTITSTVTALTAFGIATGVMLTPCMPMMAAAADRSFGAGGYGAAFGIVNTAYSVGLAAAPMVATPLAKSLGFLAVMVLYGVLLLTLAVVMTRALAHSKALR
ncbi:MAG: MFS transporter, partial [Alicyclobacillaceae bacterium]|nr:MFS transporter [Alicyclobacillaceae bacterium]